MGALDREIQSMALIDHPNVIKLFGYYEDNQYVYFVMEALMGGTLFDTITENVKAAKPVDEMWLGQVFRQALKGIAHCHDRNLIHKDLKSENIMLVEKLGELRHSSVHCVIIDFGLAEIFEISAAAPGKSSENGDRCSGGVRVGGTPSTMAPEIWAKKNNRKGGFGPKCDIYSLGCVLFRTLSKKGLAPIKPASGASPAEWLRAIQKGPSWNLVAHMSVQSQDLARSMMCFRDAKRPDAHECLEHPWFKLVPLAGSTLSKEQVSALEKATKRTNFEHNVMIQVATQFSIQRMPNINAMFRKYDIDNSGTLNREELSAMLIDLGASPEAAANAGQALDVDGSGEVEYTEFVSSCISVFDENMREHLWRCFQRHDANADGVLSRNEVANMLRAGECNLPPQGDSIDIAAVLDFLDTNRDGTVSFDEFRRFFAPDHTAAESRPVQ